MLGILALYRDKLDQETRWLAEDEEVLATATNEMAMMTATARIVAAIEIRQARDYNVDVRYISAGRIGGRDTPGIALKAPETHKHYRPRLPFSLTWQPSTSVSPSSQADSMRFHLEAEAKANPPALLASVPWRGTPYLGRDSQPLRGGSTLHTETKQGLLMWRVEIAQSRMKMEVFACVLLERTHKQEGDLVF